MLYTKTLALIFLGLGGVYFAGTFMRLPVMPLLKAVLYVFLGGVLLVVLHPFFSFIGINMPLNWITASVVGILQLPGLILLILLSHFYA